MNTQPEVVCAFSIFRFAWLEKISMKQQQNSSLAPLDTHHPYTLQYLHSFIAIIWVFVTTELIFKDFLFTYPYVIT